MRQLFLTSDVHSVAHDFTNYLDLSKNNKLVFIDTAAEPEKAGDMTWLTNDRKALVDVGFEVTNYTITGKKRDELASFLPIFDYIYCSGGNTMYLLDQSYKTGFIDIVKKLVFEQNKIYIGTSAGSIIAGPYPLDCFTTNEYPNVLGKKAFELIDFTIVPHWGSKDFKDVYLGEKMQKIYNEQQPPLVLLSNHQYAYVQDDLYKLIDVK